MAVTVPAVNAAGAIIVGCGCSITAVPFCKLNTMRGIPGRDVSTGDESMDATAQTHTHTPWTVVHRKRCHFILDYNFSIS